MKKFSRIFISLLLVLSMSIITALSANASTTKNYSFYISNTGSVTNLKTNPISPEQNDSFYINVHLSSKVGTSSVQCKVYVKDKLVLDKKINSIGDHSYTISDPNIKSYNSNIVVHLYLNPTPTGLGSAASGYIKYH